MTSPTAETEIVPGRAGFGGGAALGLRLGALFGSVDAGVAWWRQEEALGVLEGLGCTAAAAGTYALLAAAALGLAGLLCGQRLLVLAGIAAGLFLELYWWTRPHLFWGLPATSPERLVASVGLLVVALTVAWVLRGVLGSALAGRGAAARTLVAFALGLVLLGGAQLWIDARQAGDRSLGAEGERNRDLPNVLLIVVDALRQDVIGAYGNERVDTPVMDALARRGVLFEDAFVQAPFTWASFGSILTGKYPRRHGMLKLDPKYRLARDINVTLPLHMKTAVRRDGVLLEDEDFVGAAFMTGAVTRDSGLLHGFDLYCEALLGHDLVHRRSAWSRFRSEVLLFKLWTKATQRIDYDMARSTAVEWFGTEADRRFFAFLHLYSTHTPYDPEPQYREKYVDPDYDGLVKAFYAEHRYAIEAGEVEPRPEDVEQIRNLYYGGTTQADAAIGEVLGVLEARGVLEDTIVIVTSDHGEELGEHGVWEHNWMYQTNLRIPLIMVWPGKLPANVRVPGIVDSIDILPTVADLMGLELPVVPDNAGEHEPYYRVDGTSLMPLVRGEVESVREFSFAESGSTLAVQDARTKLVVSRHSLHLEPGDPAWDEAARAPELFDLVRDPDEMENLFHERPDDVRRLLRALRDWDAALPIPREEVISSHRDLEAEELLGGLGYAEGIGTEDEDEE